MIGIGTKSINGVAVIGRGVAFGHKSGSVVTISLPNATPVHNHSASLRNGFLMLIDAAWLTGQLSIRTNDPIACVIVSLTPLPKSATLTIEGNRGSFWIGAIAQPVCPLDDYAVFRSGAFTPSPGASKLSFRRVL